MIQIACVTVGGETLIAGARRSQPYRLYADIHIAAGIPREPCAHNTACDGGINESNNRITRARSNNLCQQTDRIRMGRTAYWNDGVGRTDQRKCRSSKSYILKTSVGITASIGYRPNSYKAAGIGRRILIRHCRCVHAVPNDTREETCGIRVGRSVDWHYRVRGADDNKLARTGIRTSRTIIVAAADEQEKDKRRQNRRQDYIWFF